MGTEIKTAAGEVARLKKRVEVMKDKWAIATAFMFKAERDVGAAEANLEMLQRQRGETDETMQ